MLSDFTAMLSGGSAISSAFFLYIAESNKKQGVLHGLIMHVICISSSQEQLYGFFHLFVLSCAKDLCRHEEDFGGSPLGF